MTAIQWTDRVWNPVSGCTKVSKGCQHCYAERQADRKLPKGGFTDRPFTEVRCHPNRLDIPMHWKKPQRVFVNSMSDLFHEEVPDRFIDQVFAVMALCPQHTFQVLTKRPERMRHYLSNTTGPDNVLTRVIHAAQGIEMPRGRDKPDGPGWPYLNVWLGVSIEDQATADERIPLLLETPAALRWVSYEPALGPVDFERWLDPVGVECVDICPDLHYVRDGEVGTCALGSNECIPMCPDCGAPATWTGYDDGIDWIVVGGESGHGARPFDVEWARSTVRQCKEAGVPVFVKQLGARVNWSGCAGPDEHWPTGTKKVDHGNGRCHVMLRDRKGGDMEEWPADLRVREWPEVQA